MLYTFWWTTAADEHVCSPRDFEWIAIEPSRDPHLVSASGHKLKHYGEQAVPMKLRDGRKIWITFQVCEVNGPIMRRGQVLCQGERSMRHVLDTWWCLVAPGGWRDCGRQSSKPLRVGMLDQTSKRVGTCANWLLQWKRRRTCSSTANRCRDLDGCTAQGAYAPRADEEHIEPEILPVASLPGPREPSKEEIEKHNLLHDPAMPWCDICIQSKSRDDFHRTDKTESPFQ